MIVDEFEYYEPDVFAELYGEEEEIIPKKRKIKRVTSTKTVHNKRTKPDKNKVKKLPKAVVDMQMAYEEIVKQDIQGKATNSDWQKFFKGIIKFIMKHAYVTNFKHYVNTDSDLWGHLICTIFDRIKPKYKSDGTKSCWYIDKTTLKVKNGYNPEKCSNIGNYLLSTIKWTIINFNYKEIACIQQLSEDELLNNLGHEIVYNLDDEDYYDEMSDIIQLMGDASAFKREVNAIWKLKSLL